MHEYSYTIREIGGHDRKVTGNILGSNEYDALKKLAKNCFDIAADDFGLLPRIDDECNSLLIILRDIP